MKEKNIREKDRKKARKRERESDDDVNHVRK